MLTPLTRVLGAVGLLAHDSDGSLAGGFFCFRYGSCLYLWAEAVDQAHFTHGWLIGEAFRYAAATGASAIDAGRGDYTDNARLGLLPVALASAVYLSRPNQHLLSRPGALHVGLKQRALRAWKKN
ncbi:GNAT family N-acetyltransferase [Streptomyces sp. 110]|uniref:GNAT family N-acetyltransferase n=1 Tax=Streptomyces endocoffeicus TaxID=2898945 RepID=A0ABS1PSZ6_9ACTN|nr:GNAT family N-acetyltransferase [Streptomyces endocoffeicus]MBL1115245.1 GNAT family N-acetyltransferase [Streptomyces endocoffeicus]